MMLSGGILFHRDVTQLLSYFWSITYHGDLEMIALQEMGPIMFRKSARCLGMDLHVNLGNLGWWSLTLNGNARTILLIIDQ